MQPHIVNADQLNILSSCQIIQLNTSEKQIVKTDFIKSGGKRLGKASMITASHFPKGDLVVLVLS